MQSAEKGTVIIHIPIDSIRMNPYQPRKEVDKNSLEELYRSIKQYGLLQPIVVRQINGRDFELVAGERRLRACRMARMETVPAVVVRAGGTDSAVMALIENIQRENLNYIEEAEAYNSLLSDHGMTQEELALRLGKSQSTIANKVRILKLSPEIRQILKENNLTERHARAILRIPDERNRLRVLEKIVKKGLNVSATEEYVEEFLSGKATVDDACAKNFRAIKDVRIFSNTIRRAVDIMKKSGIDAETYKNESEEFIEYTIKIPKSMKDAV